jgi:hypothetical protein
MLHNIMKKATEVSIVKYEKELKKKKYELNGI